MCILGNRPFFFIIMVIESNATLIAIINNVNNKFVVQVGAYGVKANATKMVEQVKAKGFDECVAIISDNSVSVIVSAESLQASEAAQILAIVYDTTGINPENVSIISK